MRLTGQFRRGVAVVIAGLAVVASTVGASASPAAAIHGTFSVYSVPNATAPVQMIPGTAGDVWFVTSASQLGHIAPTGAITVLPVTVPHGTVPATLVAADADGIWAYGDTSDGAQCIVSLVRSSGHVMQRTLHHPSGVCHGGALDRAGNVWVSAGAGSQGAYETCPCRVTEVSPAGAVTVHVPDTPGARPTAVALGSDGAIWVLEFNEHSFGRYAPDGSSTDVPLGGSVTPPYPGTPYWGLVPHQLFARPDGTFWLVQGGCCMAVVLSSPGKWVLRYLLPYQVSVGGMAPDGALWTVNFDRNGYPAQRLIRTSVDGHLDRSAALPPPVPGQVMKAAFGGALAAASNGAIWFATASTSAHYVVRYQPSGS